MSEESKVDYSKYFVVDPDSPTGLRWRDDINDGIKGRGKNLHAGKPAGVKKVITGRTTTIVVLMKGKPHVVSRIVWELTYGEIPDGYIVDHLDGNPLNNKIENLACKTRADNMRNRKVNSRNKSGVTGVRKEGDSWIAFFSDENKKTVSKRFPIRIYGEDEAFRLAVEFRRANIQRLKDEFGFDYTDRHFGEIDLNAI